MSVIIVKNCRILEVELLIFIINWIYMNGGERREVIDIWDDDNVNNDVNDMEG